MTEGEAIATAPIALSIQDKLKLAKPMLTKYMLPLCEFEYAIVRRRVAHSLFHSLRISRECGSCTSILEVLTARTPQFEYTINQVRHFLRVSSLARLSDAHCNVGYCTYASLPSAHPRGALANESHHPLHPRLLSPLAGTSLFSPPVTPLATHFHL